MTEQRSFLRGPNKYRIVGGITAGVGLFCMILFPTESYPDIILYKKETAEKVVLFTVWQAMILFGFIGLFPTLKEFIVNIVSAIRAPKPKP